MKIIIPMAGMGKRMRPHTLSTPKPLLHIAGSSIVERLITDIAEMVDKVDEVAFIIGDFGKEVENKLHDIAASLGYQSKIYFQYEALGTAHALYMAKPSLEGNILVAYADTLFETDFRIDPAEDACIWVKKIEDPSQFGVVVCDEQDYITRFAEKPKTFVSDRAIIGLYYFKEGEKLRDEINYLLENDIKGNGEYQITDALERLKSAGMKIKIAEVDGWFDCGNKNAMIETNTEILKLDKFEKRAMEDAVITNTKIHQPCFIGRNVRLIDSEIGPYVSIGNGTMVEKTRITNSIIYDHAFISNSEIINSIIGNHTKCIASCTNELNLGDFSEIC